MTLTYYLCILCTCAVAMASETNTTGQRRAYLNGDVILGVLQTLHEKTSNDKCGRFYRNGLDYVEAVIFAVNQINADESILPNVTLGYDIRDFCDNPAMAMKWAYAFVTNNYLNDLEEKYQMDARARGSCRHNVTDIFEGISPPIAALIGPIDSDSSSAVTNLLQAVSMPIVSAIATSTELSQARYDAFFRTVPADSQQAKAMADVIEYFQWSYVGAIVVDHSYGRYGLRALEQESFERKTFCIAFTEYFPSSGYESKIEAIIAKLKKQKNIKVVILWSTYTPGLRVTREAARQSVLDRTWLISEGLTMQGVEFWAQESLPVVGGFLGLAHSTYKSSEFEEHLKTLNTDNPWWEEYVCVMKVDRAPNEKTNPASMRTPQSGASKGFYKDFHLSFASYLIDAVYAVAHALNDMYKCKEPDGLLDGGACPHTQPTIRPEDVLRYMRNVDFKGITGRVRFDRHGDPMKASYDVINFRASERRNQRFSYSVVGSWVGTAVPRLEINESAILWNSGGKTIPVSVCREPCPPGTRQTPSLACCWDCIRCEEGTVTTSSGAENCTECPRVQRSNEGRTACADLPVMNLQWKDPSAVAGIALMSLGLCCTLFITVVYTVHRNTAVVKASNRELSFMLLAAIAMCFVLASLYLARPTPILCQLIEVWRYTAYTTCVSVLFIKTNRIVRVFASHKPSTGRLAEFFVSSKTQILVVVLVGAIQVPLLISWLVLDPPYSFKEIKLQEHIFFMCKPCKTTTGLALQGSMTLYIVFLSIFCAVCAFKARKLPENFNEARYIGFSMYILFMPWVTFNPLSSALQGTYSAHVASYITLLSTFGLLGCMFVPKVYIMLFQPEKNTTQNVKAEVARHTIRQADSRVSIGTCNSVVMETNRYRNPADQAA